jgi:hypothetical protein
MNNQRYWNLLCFRCRNGTDAQIGLIDGSLLHLRFWPRILEKMKKFLSVLFLVFLTACATSRPDWNSRAGHYTYDDAVNELGVPDGTATLSDGTIVAEWLQHRGELYATGPYSRGFYLQTLNRFPDRFLRLVFGPDRKLVRAEHFAK